MGLQCRSLDCSSRFAATLRESLEAEGFSDRRGQFAASKPDSPNVLFTKRENAQVVVQIEWDYGILPEPPNPDSAARRAKMMAERGITPLEPESDFPVRVNVLYTDTPLDCLRRKLDRSYVGRQATLALDVEKAPLRKGQHEIKPFP